jgi:hypothetical protein
MFAETSVMFSAGFVVSFGAGSQESSSEQEKISGMNNNSISFFIVLF